MRVLGIDPGYTGAIVLKVGADVTGVWDMPVVQTKGKLKYIDGMALLAIIAEASPNLIVVEQVASRPKQGVASSFAFGVAFGGVLSVALSFPCEMLLVVPAKWKRKYGLIGQSKEGSRQKAIRLFPEMVPSLKRKKDNGRAEAALLADYGQNFS